MGSSFGGEGLTLTLYQDHAVCHFSKTISWTEYVLKSSKTHNTVLPLMLNILFQKPLQEIIRNKRLNILLSDLKKGNKLRTVILVFSSQEAAL